MQSADWLQARGLAYEAPMGRRHGRPPEEHAGTQAALPPGEPEKAPVRWLTSKVFFLCVAAVVHIQMAKQDLAEMADGRSCGRATSMSAELEPDILEGH